LFTIHGTPVSFTGARFGNVPLVIIRLRLFTIHGTAVSFTGGRS